MNIAIGADHRGVQAAIAIADALERQGHTVEVAGGGSDEPCDYPDRAYQVGRSIASGRAERGVLICGTGIGMSMAANKVAGVRAALVYDELTAHMARSHNDANVMCLSADLLGIRLIEKIVQRFIETEFEGGRHARRVAKLGLIERGEDPAGYTGA
jgi:ribose 5-phosphate isomerase B